MVTFRPARSEDREFLLSVYASTRAEELAPVPWTAEQKDAFLKMQFDAQDAQYHQNYTGATFDVIEVGGVPAGRLYIHRTQGEILLMDIALLPAFRAHGIGTGILRDLFKEADAQGKKVAIHVEVNNPARRLYDRLGFEAVSERGLYILMTRRPAPAVGAVS